MQLTDHQWKPGRYTSDGCNILNGCVRPMLQNSISYSRSVGYLKKSHFNDIGLDLLGFVEGGGKAQFLIGDPLEADVLLACENALMSEKTGEVLQNEGTKLGDLLKQNS